MVANALTKALPSAKVKHFAMELGLISVWRGVLESGNAEAQTRYEGISYGTDAPVQHMVIRALLVLCYLTLCIVLLFCLPCFLIGR